MLVIAKLMGTFNDILILVGILSQSKNAVRRNTVEKNFQKYYNKMDNPSSCDFTALIKMYKDAKGNFGQYYRDNEVFMDVGNEARKLIEDIERRFNNKNLPIFNMYWTTSKDYWTLASKLGIEEDEEYDFRFKMTIMCGFIENFLKIREAALDDKQEKRLKLMKKTGIPHRNTFCILKSQVIKLPGSEASVQSVKKHWRQKIEQATGIRGTELTMTLGLSYLHFSNERDIQKFAFLKYMQENRRDYNPLTENKYSSSRFSFSELNSALGDMDLMHVGRPVTMIRDQTVFVENLSLNRLVVMNENDKPKYLVCNNLCKTSSRMNARYTSLLPNNIPHLAALAHLMFYPFLGVIPSQDKSKYQWMQLKRSHRLPIPY